MNRKFWLSLTALLLALAMLAACGGKTPPAETVTTLAQNDMAYELADASGIEVHDFELEDGEVRTWNDRPVAAPLAGSIAVPQGEGPHPLVVIVHGAKRVDSIREKVYAGFDYLVRQLAAEGYAAMSINVNLEYSLDYGESIENAWGYSIFQQHLALLEQANVGEDTGHGIDLEGKINLDEMHLIGHSRGGESIDTFARQEKKAGLSRIQSLIRVASTNVIYHSTDESLHLDIPVGIILPEFDGDLRAPFAQQVFDEILRDTENQSIASVVYLRGANHNFFNRAVLVDDRTADDDSPAMLAEATWLTREQQEDFLMRYAAAFLSALKGEQLSTFDPQEPQPVRMFGLDVIASSYLPGVQNIWGATGTTGFATGTASARQYVQRMNSDGFFNHPSVINWAAEELPMNALSWDENWIGTDGNGAMVSFTPYVYDFSNAFAMSLYVAVDSSNELNPQGQNQAFTVRLTDRSGARSSVMIPAGTSALTWHPGSVYEYQGGYINENDEWVDAMMEDWQGFMPLGELRIPLRYFGGIDMETIASIEIVFDQTASGAVMLEGIYLK